MITAVDTNVLLDLLVAGAAHGDASTRAMAQARTSGALVMGEVVFAELAAAFSGDLDRVGDFLEDLAIRFIPSPLSALAQAGGMWRQYRRSGGARQRVIADFLVGAHALECADRLLTRDRGFYRKAFGELVVYDPLE